MDPNEALRLQNAALRECVEAFKVKIAFIPASANLPNGFFKDEVELAQLASKISYRTPEVAGAGIRQLLRNAALAAVSLPAVETEWKRRSVPEFCSEVARRVLRGQFVCGPEPS